MITATDPTFSEIVTWQTGDRNTDDLAPQPDFDRDVSMRIVPVKNPTGDDDRRPFNADLVYVSGKISLDRARLVGGSRSKRNFH
jgi:hypothetical protein